MHTTDEVTPKNLKSARPLGYVVLALALPVLAQQFLLLVVTLSDRYLAGNFQPATPGDKPAYQAAQTTANYLAWFISSYVVLVSVGSTALVARFTGAGNLAGRTHATN